MREYYEILGLSEGATVEEIAYFGRLLRLETVTA